MAREIIYVGDPMCSWCWGFSPVMRKIADQISGRADFSIFLGGLRSETEPMTDDRKVFLRDHWIEIGERSGQPFKLDILETTDFVYDTEPPCRAVVTVRSASGDAEALRLFEGLQKAFYAESRYVTKPEVAAEVVGGIGLDTASFLENLGSDDMRARTQQDFVTARQMGVSGFPTVLVREDDKLAYLTRGYQPYENIEAGLEQWLEHGFPEPPG